MRNVNSGGWMGGSAATELEVLLFVVMLLLGQKCYPSLRCLRPLPQNLPNRVQLKQRIQRSSIILAAELLMMQQAGADVRCREKNTSFTAVLHPLAWSLYALVGGAASCSTQGSLGMFMCTVYTPVFAVNRHVCPQNANTAKLIQEYCRLSLENA